MGRKSKGRNSNSSSLSTNTSSSNISVREMMRGLKNRWGRFQCPRDGSICKSLEAWHWHRHKYHQTEHINYVELDPDVADSNAPGGATPQSTTTTTGIPPSSSSSSHPPLLLSPSSPRLLPPEAFAPRRPPDVVHLFPDDASDLTEPDAPVLLLLLSEEVTSREEAPTGSGEPAEEVQWEVMDESTSVADDDDDDEQIAGSRQVTMTTTMTDSRLLEPEAAAARLHGNDFHGNQESKTAAAREFRATQSPARETSVHRHGNGIHGYQRERYYRPRSQPPHCPAASSCHASSGPASSGPASSGPTTSGPTTSGPATSGPTTSGPTTSASLSSAMDLVAVYVLRLLERDRSPRPTAHDILREVDAHFSGLGLSRDGLEGVVAGALMGARDQWTNGYNAGWKDGAKEVLNAPLLRSVTPSPLHSPDGVATTWNTGQVTLLTPGRRSKDEREDTLAAAEKVVELSRDSIENVETSADQSRDSSTHRHGNDPNNNNDASS